MITSAGNFQTGKFNTYHPRMEGGLLFSYESWNPNGNNTYLSNGANVSSLADTSGNGVTATQATMADQPTFSTNVLNGQPAIQCQSSNFMSVTAPTFGASNTFFFVGTPAATANRYMWSGSGAGEGPTIISKFSDGMGNNPTYQFYNAEATENNFSLTATGVNICQLTQVDATSSVGYFNNTSVFSYTPAVAVSGTKITHLFCNFTNQNQYDGQFFALFWFNWAFPAAGAVQKRVFQYLAYKLGTSH